jgi:hypothetical protein
MEFSIGTSVGLIRAHTILGDTVPLIGFRYLRQTDNDA